MLEICNEKGIIYTNGLVPFEFNPEGCNPVEGWQDTTLHILFNIKQYLRRKYRLVSGGYLIDMVDIPLYSSTVKDIIVQILHVITHKSKMNKLCGDIGNAFPNSYTNEKLFVQIVGP